MDRMSRSVLKIISFCSWHTRRHAAYTDSELTVRTSPVRPITKDLNSCRNFIGYMCIYHDEKKKT